jgi:hypothetical protein
MDSSTRQRHIGPSALGSPDADAIAAPLHTTRSVVPASFIRRLSCGLPSAVAWRPSQCCPPTLCFSPRWRPRLSWIPGKLSEKHHAPPRLAHRRPIAALYLAAVTCIAFRSLGAICCLRPPPAASINRVHYPVTQQASIDSLLSAAALCLDAAPVVSGCPARMLSDQLATGALRCARTVSAPAPRTY